MIREGGHLDASQVVLLKLVIGLKRIEVYGEIKLKR